MSTFTKQDSTKLRWHLLPRQVMRDVVKVLEYGAIKYAPNNWQLATTKDAQKRMWDALDRHRDSIEIDNELYDTESNLPHTAHMLANLIFLHWHLHCNTPSPTKKESTDASIS